MAPNYFSEVIFQPGKLFNKAIKTDRFRFIDKVINSSYCSGC